MKKFLLLFSFVLFCLYSFTQTNIQQDNRVSSVLKRAVRPHSGYNTYGRTGRFINMAVLNPSSHIISWFTCHGRLFDSTRLDDQEFEQVISKQLDPFTLYQNICDKYLADIAAAKDIYRVYGGNQFLERSPGNYQALFAMGGVQAAKTPLQKLMAIENVRKKMLTQLAWLNCANPASLHDDPQYRANKELAGAMVQTKDSTVYYNIDPASAVAKISLYKSSPEKLYVQNRLGEVIDSVCLLPAKSELLQKEKTDVFLLYRGWLEMQWQEAMYAIKINNGEYRQVNNKEAGYRQLNAIRSKINILTSPQAKCIEQAVYDTYKSETSEIYYIPLLGISYNLVQTRGLKEYELTNHIGNVLVTVSDRKNGVPSSANSSLIDHYEPDIVSAQDYYPFGMLQPGRSISSGEKYRYGFNGKENDNEVKGVGNQQDYGMRIYDPRVGKFLSVDPLTSKYPELTPYQFASNRPVDGVDEDGLEWAYYDKDNKQVDINDKTTDQQKLSITGVKWVGYDVDDKGNKTPKAGSVSTAYTFGLNGMTTSGVDAKGNPTRTWASYLSLGTGNAANDKKIATLHSSVQGKMIEFILKAKYRFDIGVTIWEGYRTEAKQDEYFSRGRGQDELNSALSPYGITRRLESEPELDRNTDAPGGYSNHNFGLAMDVVPVINGKQNDSKKAYDRLGPIGESIGLQWGRYFPKLVDNPHFQDLQGKSLRYYRKLPKDANGLPIIPAN